MIGGGRTNAAKSTRTYHAPVKPTGQPDPPCYLEPYRDAVDRLGATFGATLWASRDHQSIRFRVLTEMVDCAGALIVDAGAGLGDFAQHLQMADVRYARYIGLEAVQELHAAAARRALARAEFHAVDFFRDEYAFPHALQIDRGLRPIIVFCGSLNTMRESDARTCLDRAWRSLPAGTGASLVFNFLSGSCCRHLRAEPAKPARRFSPQHMADWAFAHTPRIRLRSDYFPGGHDATIAMWKE